MGINFTPKQTIDEDIPDGPIQVFWSDIFSRHVTYVEDEHGIAHFIEFLEDN